MGLLLRTHLWAVARVNPPTLPPICSPTRCRTHAPTHAALASPHAPPAHHPGPQREASEVTALAADAFSSALRSSLGPLEQLAVWVAEQPGMAALGPAFAGVAAGLLGQQVRWCWDGRWR